MGKSEKIKYNVHEILGENGFFTTEEKIKFSYRTIWGTDMENCNRQ